MKKALEKIFGELKMSWPVVIILAIVLGIYTGLMAMFVPDGNSFHDIAVTAEWWILPAILIIVNSKKPLEAALKTFVFFLISQPIVYLVQVPTNSMSWGLFGYYKYWFIITLLTFPGAFLGWFIKKDKWYSGLILSVMTVLLVITGVQYVKGFPESFPNHLISAIYCFVLIPILIFGIFKDKIPKIICSIVTAIAIIVVFLIPTAGESFEAYNNVFLEENGIVLVGEPKVTNLENSEATLNKIDDNNYMLKVAGAKDKKYYFSIVDDEHDYLFTYYFDNELQTIVVELQ